ncbi:preprotein translocase subunit SecG [Paracoccus sediminicola]|uniref:preprotein translocase subunit SecG n=1 Tax=Paracoccus sediminicola TaxID=3017783 RepID=UPI0022F01277|nr:preprotein translocase subunit SecG [Paracoccus sediminicola]WBU56979.1 preprotein translocase subunit SecG [Paracoccus sediminicola]
MENVVLTVHLILALLLIGVVLLQRSEGGGLGMGGGGGAGGGVMSGRQAANALSKMTWILAVGFLITSITLTVIAARNVSGASVLDQLEIGAGTEDSDGATPALPEYTPPPGVGQPVAPPAPESDAPAATEAEAPAPAAETDGSDAPVTPPAAN